MRVLLCIALFMPSLGQNLKGSAEVASVSKSDITPEVQSLEATDAASISIDDLPPKHPPTTNQAILWFVLIFAIPAVGLFIMKKGKDSGWEGAFGVICGLITLLWIYTAVLAFM
eukprot:Skav224443  [mRNA]  locus=scaffold3543:36445:36786:- [translate_table: standard]